MFHTPISAELKSRISVTEYLTWVMHKFIKLPLSNLKHPSWEWSDLSQVAQCEPTKLKETIPKRGRDCDSVIQYAKRWKVMKPFNMDAILMAEFNLRATCQVLGSR